MLHSIILTVLLYTHTHGDLYYSYVVILKEKSQVSRALLTKNEIQSIHIRDKTCKFKVSTIML